MDKNKKILLKIFDLDDDLVENVSLETDMKRNTLYVKFKRTMNYCSVCGSVKLLSKGYYTSTLVGCPFNGKPTLIKCKINRFVCKNCGSYPVDENPISYKNTNMTRTAVITILNELKPYTATYSQIANRFGTSTSHIMNLFDRYVRVKRKKLPRVLLIDEFYFSRKVKFKHPTILMNFENNVIIDVIKSRKQEVTLEYFFHIPKEEKEAVEFICTDMSYTFKPLLQLYFPHSTLLVDHFHVIKYINDQLNNTRIRVMRKYSHDKTSLNYRILKNKYKLLLKNEEDLDDETYKNDHILGFTTTQSGIVYQMTLLDDEINRAYKLKELYRAFDSITKKEINNYDMEKELNSIIKQFKNSNIEEMIEVAETLKNWKQEILNSFVWIKDRRISNGPIEGKNHYIKKILYNGNGMQNFERARNRILYSQNKYESYDLDIEYTDSIKMKKEDLLFNDDETDEFEE
ncbi:ISL3 family transposase [Massilimicrobiota sp. SW1139]|uniref:ISL3 family transposase n=1 Tax=Massilimicrobiota sp. SW1139 TaxID=2530043 RepID=UPI00143AB365|nr:ISL3 family transposase [Massilimicrobiota sp. SW1139]